MVTMKDPSDDVLEKVGARALKLLGALSTNPQIFAALAGRGYTNADHEKGWTLLLEATGYRQPRPAALEQPKARAAIAELDAWDEPNFRIARAALQTAFPEQHGYVFEGVEAGVGAAAIVSITTFLDRLDALEAGKDRKATKKDDQAALEKLAARGITREERKRLRGLLEIALAMPDAAPAAAIPATVPERRKQLRALWAWHSEWSEVAKAVIKRRDHLILLGLAKRKAREKGAEVEAATEE